MNPIRLLRADEIECRVSTINEKGLSLLLYKDARVDQRILDETFTPLGWQRTHQSIDGNLYCTVEIWDDARQQWIAKQDVGTMSYTEEEKGQASDSFKRACFNIGIGRELYTAPDFIWVTGDKVKIQKKGEKFITYDRFHVQSIEYNDQREIAALVIANSFGKVVYSWVAPKAATRKPTEESQVSNLSDAQIQALNAELARTGTALDTVLQRYKVNSLGDLQADMYQRAMNSLKRTKAKSSTAA